MKISRPSADELIVSDMPVFTGGLCAVSFLLFASIFLQTALKPHAETRTLVGTGLGALVAGIGTAYVFKKTVVHFDRRIGQVMCIRQGILGTQTSHISFSEIKDVVVEVLTDTHGSTYRVAILATPSRWPLTDYYSGNRMASENVKDQLRAFLGFTSQTAAISLEDRLRGLIVSGQTLEAIQLARLERHLSLKEAKEWVDNLGRTA